MMLKHCRLPKALKPSNMSERCPWALLAHFCVACRTKRKDVALMSTITKNYILNALDCRRENVIQ